MSTSNFWVEAHFGNFSKRHTYNGIWINEVLAVYNNRIDEVDRLNEKIKERNLVITLTAMISMWAFGLVVGAIMSHWFGTDSIHWMTYILFVLAVAPFAHSYFYLIKIFSRKQCKNSR